MSAFGPKQTSAFAPHMSALRGKADMTLCGNALLRSVLEAKRKSIRATRMYAVEPKRKGRLHCEMSAFYPKQTGWKCCIGAIHVARRTKLGLSSFIERTPHCCIAARVSV